MKKLLTLILVLAMVSISNAALQISVDGDWNPVDSEIVVMPSQEITLGLWTDAAIPDSLTWTLYCDTSLGSITGGTYVGPDDGGNILGFVYWPATLYGVDFGPWPYDGLMGGVAVFGGSGISADTLLFDDITFHAESIGDTILYLGMVDNNTGEIVEVMDSVVIHVPEPATLFLLGLGMLAVRQKRTH